MTWFCNNWICSYPPDIPHIAHRQWSPIDTMVLQQLNLQLSPRHTPHRTQAMVPHWHPGSVTTESAVIPQTYRTSHGQWSPIDTLVLQQLNLQLSPRLTPHRTQAMVPHWHPGSVTTESAVIPQTYRTSHGQWSPIDTLVLQQLNLSLSPRLTPYRTQAMVPHWHPGSVTTESVAAAPAAST